MNIYDFFNPFWEECGQDPMTPSEVALFHYLLSEANRRHWEMPLRCYTKIICHYLSTTRQNIQKARISLRQRGWIDFTEGKGKNKPAEYTLQISTHQLSYQLPPQLQGQLPVQLPLYKTKDIDKDNISLTPRACEDGVLSFSDLKGILMADMDWKELVISSLKNEGFSIQNCDEIDSLLSLFLQKLEIEGICGKTLQDGRSHFYNWMRQNLTRQKQNSYVSNEQRQDNRRKVDLRIPDKSEGYDRSF